MPSKFQPETTLDGAPNALTINSARVIVPALGIFLLAFSVELYVFARAQDVWIDESTQLSGITLSPWEMIRWLTGTDTGRFGVSGDRMPPISYLLDWSWFRLLGSSELSFRTFHAAFVVAGALTLAILALRKIGPTAAVVTLAFLVLSPKMIWTGVEIRAYPIFFAVTCAQVAAFLTLVPRLGLPSARIIDIKLLAGFGALCLIAIFTHFYGVVSTAAFFLALACEFAGSPRSLAALAIAGTMIVLGSSGLIPFITSAVDMSSVPVAKETSANQYLIYALRLFGDSADMVSVPAAVAFFGGTIALLAASIFVSFARLWTRKAQPIDWLWLVVIAGATIPVLASFAIKRFDVLKPDYSGWLLAPLALLIGAGASSATGFWIWDRRGRIVAIAATIGGACISTFFFLNHSDVFIHGPQRFVGSVFDRTDEPKAIIYEADAPWGFSYFPLVFTHKNTITQYRATDGGRQLLQLKPGAADMASADIDAAVIPFNHLLLVDSRLRNYRDIRACESTGHACPGFPRSEVAGALIKTGHWKERRVERSFGQYDTRVTVMDRTVEQPRLPNNQR